MELALALELEIDTKELARRVISLNKKTAAEKEEILRKADEEISREKSLKAIKLVEELCYYRLFCKNAGINYANIKETDSRLIKIALADYLLSKN
jgi:hypothetical protein